MNLAVLVILRNFMILVILVNCVTLILCKKCVFNYSLISFTVGAAHIWPNKGQTYSANRYIWLYVPWIYQNNSAKTGVKYAIKQWFIKVWDHLTPSTHIWVNCPKLSFFTKLDFHVNVDVVYFNFLLPGTLFTSMLATMSNHVGHLVYLHVVSTLCEVSETLTEWESEKPSKPAHCR